MGRYQTENSHAETSCTVFSTCGKGQKQNVGPTLKRNRECTICVDGRFQSSTSHVDTSCTVWKKCGAGQKQSTAPSLSVDRGCSLCDAGRYQPSNSHAVTPCKACNTFNNGFFCLDPTQSKCQVVSFAYSDAPGAITCNYCIPGQFVVDGNTACKPCLVGKYQPQSGQRSCKPCSGNYYASEEGKGSCSLCDVGKYRNIEHTGCVECPVGRWENGRSYRAAYVNNGISYPESWTSSYVGSSECDICRAGKFSDKPGASVCKTCEIGKSIDDNGSDDQEHLDATACKCGPGHYQTNPTDPASCIACGIGRYNTESGKTSVDENPCLRCGPGKYGNVGGQTSERTACGACPSGKWSSTECVFFSFFFFFFLFFLFFSFFFSSAPPLTPLPSPPHPPTPNISTPQRARMAEQQRMWNSYSAHSR